jgi:trk system potassium uptake protein TrkH
VDIGALRSGTLLMMMVLMFIGASPGSCGGGIKTTTMVLAGVVAFRRIVGPGRIALFRKSIPEDTVDRSLSLVLISCFAITAVFFLILAVEGETLGLAGKHDPFLALLFETVSAFGTVGLSMGATPLLGTWGKSLIIFMMLLGRVGVLTFAYSVIGGRRVREMEYSEQNIMIG